MKIVLILNNIKEYEEYDTYCKMMDVNYIAYVSYELFEKINNNAKYDMYTKQSNIQNIESNRVIPFDGKRNKLHVFDVVRIVDILEKNDAIILGQDLSNSYEEQKAMISILYSIPENKQCIIHQSSVFYSLITPKIMMKNNIILSLPNINEITLKIFAKTADYQQDNFKISINFIMEHSKIVCFSNGKCNIFNIYVKFDTFSSLFNIKLLQVISEYSINGYIDAVRESLFYL